MSRGSGGGMRQKVVAVLEFVGGALGLISLLAATRIMPTSVGGFGTLAVTAAIYLLALIAGVLLWRGARQGRGLSIVVQLIQLPKLVTMKFAFMMSFGFDLFAAVVLGQDAHGFSLSTKVGSFDLIRLGDVGLPWLCGISITSCLSLFALLSGEAIASANRYATILFWMLAGSALAISVTFLVIEQIGHVSAFEIGITSLVLAALGVALVTGLRTVKKRRREKLV